MKIITGMHRSGTSIVARLLFTSGADFGDPETFYPGDRWNPDGYFEQREIHSVNMPLIHGPWGKLAYFWLPSTAVILQRSKKYSEAIKGLHLKYRKRFVKEARFCLTLAAWLKQESEIEQILVCLREPMEVARSLQKRNKISLARGLALWELHYRRLLEVLHAQPNIRRHFLHYNRIVENPMTGLAEIAAMFSFFEMNSQFEKLRPRIPEMIKGRGTGDQEPIAYPMSVRELWNELLQLHAAQSEIQAQYSLKRT